MSDLERDDRAQFVRGMFDRISPKYDLLNRLITFGQDGKWRSDAIRLLYQEDDKWVLDLGTGTGDLALEIAERFPGLQIVGLDFSRQMIKLARARKLSEDVHWVIADASHLPFKEGSFNGVIYAFLLRNVVDLPDAIQEQFRILLPGGKMVCLETTPPRPGFLTPLIGFYLDVIVPLLGKWFANDMEAYRYLRDTTLSFLKAEDLADRFRRGGFHSVRVFFRMLKTIAIHMGRKPFPGMSDPH